ncbi:tautomerase family protein [Rhodococcus sp. NPDC003994]
MPVAHIHLPADTVDAETERALLLEVSARYSRVLESPIDRVRVFLVHYPRAAVAVGGQIVEDGATVAPYFTAIVLTGRPESQIQELLRALTDAIADHLPVDRASIRGRIIRVEPANWGIAGVPAATTRAAEIAARAAR